MASPSVHTGQTDSGLIATPSELRAAFPAIANATYLNAAASSPLCLPVERALSAHIRETVERGDAGFMRWLAHKESVRGKLAAFLGAEASDLAFTPNTSMGFHAVARIFKARGVREVVTLDAEFPSTTLPLLAEGLTLRAVKRRADGSYSVSDVEAALTKNTGAVALSQVQYASGFQMDVAAVGKLCRDRKLLFALNACQAMGQVKVDFAKTGCDFLCGTSHKWLMAGFGGGIFIGKKEEFAGVIPPWAGWLSTDDAAWKMETLHGATLRDEGNVTVAEGGGFRHDAQVLEAGSHAWTPIIGLGAAVEVLASVGIEAIERHNRALQGQLRTELRRRGFTPNAPDDAAAGICVVKVSGPAEEAVKALAQSGVVTSPRGGGIRISTHVFNSSEDVIRLCEAMDRLQIRPG